METTIIFKSYIIYVIIITFLTLFVARTLFKNGRIFMIDIFRGKTEIALATNKLFEVGFYLLNLGFAFRTLKIRIPIEHQNMQYAFEVLSGKIGGYTIYLGIMLFFNLFLFFRGRKAARAKVVLANQGGFTPPKDLENQ